MSTRFLTEKDKTDLLDTLDKIVKEINARLDSDFYSKLAIDAMFEHYTPEKEELLFTKWGVAYEPEMVLDSESIIGGAWRDADKLISLELTNWNPTSANNLKLAGGANANDTFQSPSLKTLILPKLQYGGHYWARQATALETVQLGSIGYPVTSLGNYFFYKDTQDNLEITVYVNATTLSGIPSAVRGSAPWGATNATVIYRNSNTGEIIQS